MRLQISTKIILRHTYLRVYDTIALQEPGIRILVIIQASTDGGSLERSSRNLHRVARCVAPQGLKGERVLSKWCEDHYPICVLAWDLLLHLFWTCSKSLCDQSFAW